MKHEQAVELLPSLADGTLSAHSAPELERHLRECEGCAAWWDTYRLLADVERHDRSPGEHPGSDELARYTVEPETLTASGFQSVADHLTACADCRRDASITAGALAADPASRRLGLPIAIAASLLLALLLAYGWVRFSEPRERRVAGDRLLGPQTVEAPESLVAQQVAVGGGGVVTFRAGEKVVLGEGFSIEPGAEFRVEIATLETPADGADSG